MEKPGLRTFFLESPTCYSGWMGHVVESSKPFLLWQVQVIRSHDWMSARLRATKAGTAIARVQIQTPSGASVFLMNAEFAAFGPAVWTDPTHPRPIGSLEMVTYNCWPLLVDNAGVFPTYDWWELNA